MEQESSSQKGPGEQVADLFLALTASEQLIAWNLIKAFNDKRERKKRKYHYDDEFKRNALEIFKKNNNYCETARIISKNRWK